MIAEVATIYERNARQIVEQMRLAADNIERGGMEDIRGAVFVLAGPSRDVEVYAWGELDNFSTLGVLARGMERVNRIIDG